MTSANQKTVEDGTTISSFRAAYEKRIFATNGDWAHVAFDAIVVDLNLAVIFAKMPSFLMLQKPRLRIRLCGDATLQGISKAECVNDAQERLIIR